MTPRSNRRPAGAAFFLPHLAAASLALGAALLPERADAQQTTVIGQPHSGSVSVDFSVLDGLGQPQNIPQLYRPSVRTLLMPNAAAPRAPARRQLAAPAVGGRQLPASSAVRLKPPSRKSSTRSRTPKSAAKPRTTRRVATRAPAPKRVAPAARAPATAKPAPIVRPPAVPAPPVVRAPTPPPPAVRAPAPPPPPKIAAVPPPPKIAAAPPSPPKPPAAAPPPAPVAAPAAAPEKAKVTSRPANTQTASLPPAPDRRKTGKLAIGQQFRLIFGGGDAGLDSDTQKRLTAIAAAMGRDEALRLQLLGFAGEGSQTANRARRLSLSRALAVRSFLLKQGVVSTRIDVRALGNKFEGGPPDRVDVIVTSR